MAFYDHEELSEVRVVDPTTGGEKGSKLARFSLIPPEFLWALAEHYGKGANKYTKVLTIVEACATIGNICTCNTQNTVSSEDSDALGTIRTVLQQHKPTCSVQRLKFQPSSVPGEIKLSGDRNWERGYKWSLSVDALERHLTQWKQGEIFDPETGTHHLICVAWHACALFCYSIFGKGTNDIHNRPLTFIQGAEKG